MGKSLNLIWSYRTYPFFCNFILQQLGSEGVVHMVRELFFVNTNYFGRVIVFLDPKVSYFLGLEVGVGIVKDSDFVCLLF